ncbi:hypothetical protein HYW87_00005, partial [Candidatus Roizmanbacteria bacterium]|nr:hypothetical protein [Candidatus Roizmanbacteria bacterium]
MLLFFLLGLLVALWYLGYIHLTFFSIPDIVLFEINGHPITLYNLLIFLVGLVIVSLLPYPFKQIVIIFLILFVLTVLGIIPVIGLAHLFVVAIIITFVAFLLGF